MHVLGYDNQARLGGVIPVFARPRRFTHFERAVNVRVPAHDASAPARVVLGSSATAATNTDLATATWTLRRVGSTGDYRAKWTVRAQKLCRDGGSGRYMAAGDPVTVAARTVTDLAMTTVRQQIRLPERGLWRLEVTGHEDSVNAAVTLIRITGDNVHAFSEFTYTAEEVSGSGIELNLGGSASGPFPACPPHRTVRRIAVDYIAPGGIWYHQREQSTLSNTQVTTRVEVRRIDDRGRPLEQRFTSLGSRRTWGHAASSLAQNARRWTEVYELPARARYEVRVTYVGFDTRGASILARGDRLTWAGLRGYVGGSPVRDDVTRIAVKMKATGQLSGHTARRLNVIATRRLPAYATGKDGTVTQSPPAATRSIAWAAMDLLTNTDYGAGFALEDLLRHPQRCRQRPLPISLVGRHSSLCI